MKETQIDYVALDRVKPSKTNPRQHFDEKEMVELAENVRQNGILQPLLARPDWCIGKSDVQLKEINGNAPAPEFFEVVAGERRLRAAERVKLASLPLIVRELSDQEAIELQLIENLQRDDLDPFEEADGYQHLLDLRDADGKPVHTVETISKRVGKVRSRIYHRLKLRKVPKAVRESVMRQELLVDVAESIGTIPTPELRKAASEEILHPEFEEGPLNRRKARDLIAAKYMRSLAGAAFVQDDVTLVPPIIDEQTGERLGGGSCGDCPMRTGNMEAIIGKTKRPDVCTNPKCFSMKCDAHFARIQENAVKEGKRILTSDETAEIFEADPDNHNFAAIRYDAPYVKLSDRPDEHEVRSGSGRPPTWRVLLEKVESKPAILIARDPKQRVVELVDRALAIEAIKLSAKQKGEVSIFDERPRAGASRTGGSDADGETPWKKQDKKNREIAKMNFQISLAAMTELIGAIDKKGMIKGFWDNMIELAIFHSGHDGHWFICKRIGLDPKAVKKKAPGSLGHEEAVREYAQSLTEEFKPGFVVELLMSRELKWCASQTGPGSVERFDEFSKLYKIDVNEIERRVKAEKRDASSSKKKGDSPSPATLPPGPYRIAKAVTLPGERQTYGVVQGELGHNIKNPYQEHGLTKAQAQKRLKELNTVVAHDFEKITDNKYRCQCGAFAVKHEGEMLLAKEFRGRPCSRSENPKAKKSKRKPIKSKKSAKKGSKNGRRK